METAEMSSSLGTQPDHALSNPPGPLSKPKGLAQGLWLETGDAGGQQVLHSFAVVSVSSEGVTLDLPHSPGLGAQTSLLIPSASPGKPITRKMQLLSLTDDQDLPTADEPAVLGPWQCPHHPAAPGSDHCPETCPGRGDTAPSWCWALTGTRPSETAVTQTQLGPTSLHDPSHHQIIFTPPAKLAKPVVLTPTQRALQPWDPPTMSQSCHRTLPVDAQLWLLLSIPQATHICMQAPDTCTCVHFMYNLFLAWPYSQSLNALQLALPQLWRNAEPV